MKKLFFCFVLMASMSVFVIDAYAQQSGVLPVATTVFVADSAVATGDVIVFEEKTQTYTISKSTNEANIYGVVANRPALVFQTATGTMPVVSIGATLLKVSTSGGEIKRGDLLVASKDSGVAQRAGEADTNVFAIALEPFLGDQGSGGMIQAEVDVERAHALREARLAQAHELKNPITQLTTPTKTILGVSLVRGGIAFIVAVGALFFILYSFRSAFGKGIVSIGRNPRARNSIIALSFGNILFALVLCGITLFVAIAILILPV